MSLAHLYVELGKHAASYFYLLVWQLCPDSLGAKGNFFKLWKLRNWVMISLIDIRDTNDRFMIVHTVFSITISSSQQGVLFAKLALTGPHFGGFVSDVTWPDPCFMSLMWLGQVNWYKSILLLVTFMLLMHLSGVNFLLLLFFIVNCYWLWFNYWWHFWSCVSLVWDITFPVFSCPGSSIPSPAGEWPPL